MMNKTEMNQLEKKLKNLSEEMYQIREKINEAKKETRLPALIKTFRNTYWIYKNSDGMGKNWNIYIHVIDIIPDSLYGESEAYLKVNTIELGPNSWDKEETLQIQIGDIMSVGMFQNMHSKTTKSVFDKAVTRLLQKKGMKGHFSL